MREREIERKRERERREREEREQKTEGARSVLGVRVPCSFLYLFLFVVVVFLCTFSYAVSFVSFSHRSKMCSVKGALFVDEKREKKKKETQRRDPLVASFARFNRDSVVGVCDESDARSFVSSEFSRRQDVRTLDLA